MEKDMVALLVPICGIIFGVGIGIVAIVAGHRQRIQKAELRHRERILAIEKGLELPSDSPEPDPGIDKRPRHLLRGLILLFVGLAVTTALSQTVNGGAYLYGLIVAAVGVAYLIYYFVEGRHETARAHAPPGSPPV